MADYLNTNEYLRDLFAKMNIANPTPAQKETAPVTVPIGQSTIAVSTDMKGLVVEKTENKQENSTKNRVSNHAKDSAVAKSKPSGPSFETQVMKWFKDTVDHPKLWKSLSEEEKQRRSDIALKGMIEAYNNDPQNIKAGKTMTVAEQYALYIGRCSTKEEVMRLTRTVKAMDKDDQLESFKSSYKYQNEEFRDVAESILALDYTKLHQDNVIPAAKETNNFSEKNQIIAAENASNVVVGKQQELIDEFMSRKNEKIDTALSDQVGKFGVYGDGTTNQNIQLDCFDKILSSQYQSVKEGTALNICNLVEENQPLATNLVVKTHNEGAIKAAASQIDKYSDENKSQIRESLLASGYSSVEKTIYDVETRAIQYDTQEQTASEAEDETQSTLTTSTETISVEAVKQLVVNKDTVSIKDTVRNLSEVETISLLKQCPNMSVIKAVMGNNPSLAVLAQIGEILKDEKASKDMDYKMLLSNVGFIGLTGQYALIRQSAQNGTLKDIDRSRLEASVKIEYDKLMEKVKA